MKRQKIIAISGLKNTGKTTLIERLIPVLTERGLSVATIKHDGHRFEADRPGTDSHRHLSAGAMGSAVYDGEKFQLIKKVPIEETTLISMFPEADLILLEGFKGSDWPKIEVIRRSVSQAPACGEKSLLAVVTDLPGLPVSVPVFGPEEVNEIADYILTVELEPQ